MNSRNAHYFNQIDPNQAGSHLGADSHAEVRSRTSRAVRTLARSSFSEVASTGSWSMIDALIALQEIDGLSIRSIA